MQNPTFWTCEMLAHRSPHALRLVRCPVFNTNGILLLGSMGKAVYPAPLTVSRACYPTLAPEQSSCDMICRSQRCAKARAGDSASHANRTYGRNSIVCWRALRFERASDVGNS